MTDNVHEEHQDISPAPPTDPKVVTRRWMLLGMGALFNGLVGLAVAVPVVRYLLGPVKRKGAYNSWISLGSVDQFPAGETRLRQDPAWSIRNVVMLCAGVVRLAERPSVTAPPARARLAVALVW